MVSAVMSTMRVVLACAAIAAAATTAVGAQWEPWPWKNVPRTADGKVDMHAPARRTADGHPDLSGFWMPADAVKHLLNLAADLKPGEVPLQPWAEAIYKERIETNGKDHPGVRCWPSGIRVAARPGHGSDRKHLRGEQQGPAAHGRQVSLEPSTMSTRS